MNPDSDASMYTVGPESMTGISNSPNRPGRRGARGSRAGRVALATEQFDFEACNEVSESALRLALLTRSMPALDYIADVIDDLDVNAEVCAHLVNALPRTPDHFPCLTEMKRRCLVSNIYTHAFYLHASFLKGSVRVRARGTSEKAAKQAAHIALIKGVCEKVLAMSVVGS